MSVGGTFSRHSSRVRVRSDIAVGNAPPRPEPDLLVSILCIGRHGGLRLEFR